MLKFPFEVDFLSVEANLDEYVDQIFASLESDFLKMAKGDGFVEYTTFEEGYEVIKNATHNFSQFDPLVVRSAVMETPIVFVVLRTMLGFTPSEWAYIASKQSGIIISQHFVRTRDRDIRLAPFSPLQCKGPCLTRLDALVETACHLLTQGAPEAINGFIHRLDKADTKYGLSSLQNFSRMGVPYAMLLYERFLGRPFASHRDSISELVGKGLETAIETVLTDAGISFRKTKNAEKIPGFDQAPDFILPSEFSPRVVIEAKITEDDGTARDKVTRIQHLADLSAQREARGERGFSVVACIGGRGFGVRREDMKKLLLATRGKIFTVKTLSFLPDYI